MMDATIVHRALQNSNYLSLRIRPSGASAFSWLSGQWVDFAVADLGVDTGDDDVDPGGGHDKEGVSSSSSTKKGDTRNKMPVGGYSICSPAGSASGGVGGAGTTTFELLVQRSDHPVTRWLFERSRVDDEVLVGRPSGSCVYDPERHPRIVCLAGGVGITPLISMLRTARARWAGAGAGNENEATLYHSVRTSDDRLFSGEVPEENVFVSSEGRRVSFAEVGRRHGPDVDYFVCGPTGFIDGGVADLRSVGCQKVHFERWW